MSSKKIRLLVYRILYAILAISSIVTVVIKDWGSLGLIVLIVLLLAIIDLFSRKSNIKYPVGIELVIILFIFASIFLGEIRNYYERFPFWDTLLHSLFGVVIALIAFLFVYMLNARKGESVKLSPLFVAIFTFSFAMMLGAVWEIYEFGMDQFFGTNMQVTETGVVDTMKDLIVEGIGAFVISVFGYLYLKYGKKNYVGRMVRDFVKDNELGEIR